MLDRYKAYQNHKFQYISVDLTGVILESDHGIFPVTVQTKLQELHPFFEILSSLDATEKQEHQFSCINLEVHENALIVDLVIALQDKDSILIIIENLSSHYTSYQLAAQSRNESVINSQVLELKNEYLLEKERFKNNFIANFSHELRNPLTASIIFGDLLDNSGLDASQKGYLDIIRAANKDLKHKIDDILDISKIESGKLILNTTVFNLKALCDEIVGTYRILAHEKGLEFQLDYDKKLPEFLEGDAFRIKQIITNLLTNAIAFTTTGHVKLALSLNYMRAKKANLHIVVEDTGCGIAEKHHDTIFERFLKIESDALDSQGPGLGLAIVKHLITQMEGNIKVDSTLEEGATFSCNLNFKISDYSPSLKDELLSKQTFTSNEKHHILLVEDAELIQLSILKLLAATGHFYVSIISKGEDLVPSVLDHEVALIVISNTIQDVSITDAASAIRKLPRPYKNTPIIALTTQAYKEDMKRFKKAGVAHTITKPFDENTLLEAIYGVLS